MGKIARAIVSPLSIIDKDLGRLGLQVVAIGGQFIPGGGQIASAIATVALATLYKKKAAAAGGAGTLAAFDPKSINPDPNAPRTLSFGRCAFFLNLRYAEPSGTNDEYIDYIFALAAHRVHALDELWFDDKLAWTSAGGLQAPYSGFLEVEFIAEASASSHHTVNAGAKWGAGERLTGCATLKLRIKRSATGSTASPLAGGLPTRITASGRGMPVYDPARDSTVAGGSGPMRWDDTSTWEYTYDGDDIGELPVLQALSYLIGWRVGDVVSVGPAIPVAKLGRVAMSASTRLCEEAISLAAGGTEPRYRSGGTFLDSDDPMAVMSAFAAACCGEWVDDDGEISLRVAHDDLASATIDITDADILGPVQWVPQPPIAEQFTVVRATRTDPTAPSLFGSATVPEVTVPRTSIAPRPLNLDLRMVPYDGQAQRLTKIAAQRSLYRGVVRVRFGVRGWLLRRNMPIGFTHDARGWSSKLFRVRAMTFNADASVDVVLREENVAVHAWDMEETASVQPVIPVAFDPLSNPLARYSADAAKLADIDDGATRNLNRGTWNSGGVIYRVGDFVQFGSPASSYGCIVEHTSTGANGPGTANWTLLASAGASGAAGAAGATGPSGPPGVDGNDGINGDDGIFREFVWKRAAVAPATPTGDGIPSGWSDDPQAGSDPLWMSVAKQNLDATLISGEVWSAPIRHDGPAGATGATGAAGATGSTGATGPQGDPGPTGPPTPSQPIAITGIGTFGPIMRGVPPGGSSAAEVAFYSTPSSGTTVTVTLQYRINGGSWTTAQTEDQAGSNVEPVGFYLADTIANPSGTAAAAFEWQAIVSRTGGATVNSSGGSFVQA